MHSISATLIKPFSTALIKPLAKLICIALLFITQTAHADFRKALDAYQARDGATILKEVKDGVDKKNDDGLILFLSMLELDSILAANDTTLSSYEERKIEFSAIELANRTPPWKSIISDSDIKSLFDSLEIAAANSSLESQFRLLTLKYSSDVKVVEFKFTDRVGLMTQRANPENDKNFEINLQKLIDKGYAKGAYYFINKALTTSPQTSETAKTAYFWKKKAAKLGDTHAMLSMAADYLSGTKLTPKNEKKGMNLAKQALTKNDADIHLGEIADSLSNYYIRKGDKLSIRQAYLWGLIAYSSNRHLRTFSLPSGLQTLIKMNLIDNKEVLGELSKSSHLERLIKIPEKPEILNKTIDLNSKPVFSLHRYVDYFDWSDYYNAARNYTLDIQADGRVYLSIGNRLDRVQRVEFLTQLNTLNLSNFLYEINAATSMDKVSKIHLGKYATGCFISCDEVVIPSPSSIFNALHASYESAYFLTYLNSKDIVRQSYFEREGYFVPLELAKVLALVEKHLHTQKYRCGSVLNRQYYKDCVAYDNYLINNLAQREKL